MPDLRFLGHSSPRAGWSYLNKRNSPLKRLLCFFFFHCIIAAQFCFMRGKCKAMKDVRCIVRRQNRETPMDVKASVGGATPSAFAGGAVTAPVGVHFLHWKRGRCRVDGSFFENLLCEGGHLVRTLPFVIRQVRKINQQKERTFFFLNQSPYFL